MSGSVGAFSGSFSAAYSTSQQNSSDYTWAMIDADYVAWHVGINYSPEIVLDDSSVSRRHAEVRFADGAWHVRDLESTNGTYVNGSRIETARLEAGDRLQVGRVELVALRDAE